LFLSQVSWITDWNHIVVKYGYEKMTDDQWNTLPGLVVGSILLAHLPYILRENYRRFNNIGQRVRCKKRKIFPGITYPIFPTIEKNRTAVEKLLLGSIKDGEDPAITLPNNELVSKL
jgi:hypothetical protein